LNGFISLDGYTRKTVEDFKTEVVFEKIIDTIRLLRTSALKDKLALTFVAHKNNVHELPDYVDFVGRLGIRQIYVSNILSFTSGLEPLALYTREGNAGAQAFFDEAVTPATPGRAPYSNEVVTRWTAEIAAADGFVFVTPEYNYGPSAVLKNAIDWVYPEWNRKAAAFVGYGSAMGARGIQQLRATAIELQLAPIRPSVHIPVATLWAHFQGADVAKGLAELEPQGNAMIDDLLWWTSALKAARASARQ